VRLLQSDQLFVDLRHTLAQLRLRIRLGERGVSFSLLPPGFLSRLARAGARIIGDGSADDFLNGGLIWIWFAGHEA
jgi:hypothetical protein